MADEPRSANANVDFAALLKRLRTAAGLTQEELAERANLSVRGISDLERGLKRRPHRETVRLLTAALRLSPEASAAFLAASNPAETPRFDALPAPTSSLIGRDEAVQEVVDILSAGATRLLTLIGPGGVGKTRLALEAMTQAKDEFADGAAFVSLASVTSADMAPGTIARALGVRQTAGRPVRETLFAELRSRQALIVLDNCEQIPIGEFVAELLRRCPKLVILATSRAPLHVSGEQEQPVAPLALADPAKLPPLAEIAAIPAVALFLARAAAVKPDFALTTRNAAAVATICARLDGLPLAIELAAARIKLLTPAALLDLLDDRFRLLTGGPHDAPERHQTMRAAISWSESLLSEREKRAFRGLAAFSGGCAVDDALAVLTPDDPISGLDDLTGLIDQSLLRREDGSDDEPRLMMLETLREFASEQLAASGDEAEIRRRHAERFVSLAEKAQILLVEGDSEIWLERVEEEHDNLWIASNWLVSNHRVERALRIACDLWRFWWQRGRLREGREWIRRALTDPDGASDETRSFAYEILGNLQSDLGEYEKARRAYEDCLSLRRRAGDRPGIWSTMHNLGVVVGYQGDYQHARKLIEESLSYADESPIPDRRKALVLQALGDIDYCDGNYSRSKNFLEENLSILQRFGDRASLVYATFYLGRTMSRLDLIRGNRLLEQAHQDFRVSGDLLGAAYAVSELGRNALEGGEADRAEARYREGLELARDLGNAHCELMGIEGLAQIAADRQDWVNAARLFGYAEAGRRNIGRPLAANERVDHIDVSTRVHSALGNEDWASEMSRGAMDLEHGLDPVPRASWQEETDRAPITSRT